MSEQGATLAKSPSRALHISLWVAQALLGLAFLMIGGMKMTAQAAEMAAQAGISPPLLRFIGISELAGGLGVILPAATRVRPGLTPLAALGLLVIMVLAMALHLSRAEYPHLPPPIILGVLAAFVAWGRWRKAPIEPR